MECEDFATLEKLKNAISIQNGETVWAGYYPISIVSIETLPRGFRVWFFKKKY